MTAEEKKSFDYLNKISYLFRLVVRQNGLSIVIQELSNKQFSYHLCYENSVLASIAISEDDISINIYKYFRMLSKKVKDVNLSDFFTPEHFLFKEFAEYCQVLKDEYDKLDTVKDVPGKVEETDDSLIEGLKRENMALRLELDELKARIFKIFVST